MKVSDIKDRDGRDMAGTMLKLADRLRFLEERYFPTPEFDPSRKLICDDDVSTDESDVKGSPRPREPTMLWHDNLSLDNILVDENGVLRGIIDWQCVSCLPLYEACQFPAFLQQARDRNVEPLTPYRVTRAHLEVSGEDLREYERQLRQHQLTLLRKLFLAEMRDKCPGWVDIFSNRKDLRDYEAAVQNCDNEFTYNLVEKWVSAVEEKEGSTKADWRLHENLMPE
ncbi:hypothetical protein F4819DRAFT_209440 [Hypoxylon fuscum]|nr:hypothetical protein F4819DRAFT_209440 [Hypoxylon fuscum]